MTVRSVLVACLAAVIPLHGGCARDAGRGDPVVTVRDSAGITITGNATPDDSVRHTWWRLEGPDLDIGGADVQEPYALFRVSDALRLSDGRIAVSSIASDDIRFFDAAGVHLRTSGRSGGGPGEYQNVSALERGTADSLLVVDASARRVSVLDPGGEFSRVFDIGETAVIPRLVGRFEDGSLLAAPATILQPDQLSSGSEVTRPPFTLVRISAAGTVADTLGEFPGAERIIRVASSGGEIVSVEIMQLAFAKSPTFAVHADEVFVGSQDAAEIRVYGMDGVLRRIVRTGRAPEPVTDAHLDAHFEAQLASMPEEMREQRRADSRNRDLPHGEFVPPYGTIMTDRAGNLWVSDYDDPMDPPGRWTVYDTTGAVIARIALPERFRPFDVGDGWILGRELDDLDVEHVRLYRINKDQS